MALVFQFGSNTSSKRMNSDERLRGKAFDLGLILTRTNYDLTFDVASGSNRCAASNLVPGQVRQAWGVLYKIPDELMSRETSGEAKSMDAIEGNLYQRSPIEVCWANGRVIEEPVITYLVRNPQAGLATSVEYVSHIVAGLREHNAPDDYINYVKTRAKLNIPALSTQIDAL